MLSIFTRSAVNPCDHQVVFRDHLYSKTTWSCPNCGFTMRPPLFKKISFFGRLMHFSLQLSCIVWQNELVSESLVLTGG